MNLTQDEKFVRRELEKVYPQLIINAEKVSTTNFNKWGLSLITVAVEFFLEKPIKQQLETIEKGKLENFLTFIMNVQLKSTSSKFYNEYRKHTDLSRELYENYAYKGKVGHMSDYYEEEKKERVWQCVEEQMKDLDPYEMMVLNEILKEQNTYKSVTEKYHINYISLKTTADELRDRIASSCAKYFEYDIINN